MASSVTVARVVDLYMDDARAAKHAEIVRLAHADSEDPAQQALLLGYIHEAQMTVRLGGSAQAERFV